MGQLLNLAGLANDCHRKLILRCLVNLRLQSSRHLQQVGTLAGNLLLLWIYRCAFRRLLCELGRWRSSITRRRSGYRG